MENDIRWVQRFENFQKALARLGEAVAPIDFEKIEKISDVYSPLEATGVIQRFENTYELAWKTLQDLLEARGYNNIRGPEPVLIQALQDGYITDRQAWIALKKARALTSSAFDVETTNEIAENIAKHLFPTLKALETKLTQEQSVQIKSFF